MLTSKIPITNNQLLRVPFGHVSSWEDYVQDYPEINSYMNGEDESCTISFYYLLNPITQIYEFFGSNEENDIAEVIGLSFAIVSKGESVEDEKSRKNVVKKSNATTSVKPDRDFEAYVHIENENDRKLFLESDMSIVDFVKYNTSNSNISELTCCDESTPSLSKEECKAAKKARRLQKINKRLNNANI